MRARGSADPDVVLSIGRLVVEGYSGLAARHLSAAFRARLDQLAATRPATLDRLRTSSTPVSLAPLAVNPAGPPHQVGRAAADALWRELSR